jgi:hypothetical protein
MVRAGRPWNLQPEMSAATFGSSARYRVIRDAAGLSRPVVLPSTGTPASELYQSDSRMPLPYPPEDVWCVQLAQAATTRPAVVFVAYHQDLYNGAWVVHEPVTATLAESLVWLGCDLPQP